MIFVLGFSFKRGEEGYWGLPKVWEMSQNGISIEEERWILREEGGEVALGEKWVD